MMMATCDVCGARESRATVMINGGMCDGCADGFDEDDEDYRESSSPSPFSSSGYDSEEEYVEEEAVRRCLGMTQKGERCRISSDSANARSAWLVRAAYPLLCGSLYCRFHVDQDPDKAWNGGEASCIVCGKMLRTDASSREGCCQDCYDEVKKQECRECGKDMAEANLGEFGMVCESCAKNACISLISDEEFDDGEIEVAGTRTFEQRFAEGAKAAIDLTADDDDIVNTGDPKSDRRSAEAAKSKPKPKGSNDNNKDGSKQKRNIDADGEEEDAGARRRTKRSRKAPRRFGF